MFSLSGPNTRALLKQTNKKLSVPHLPSPTGLPCTRQKPHTLLSQSFLRSWSETPSGWPTYFLQMRLREWNRQLCAKSAAAPLTARLCPDALKHSPSLPHVQVCETEREGGGTAQGEARAGAGWGGFRTRQEWASALLSSSADPLPSGTCTWTPISPPAVLPRSACLQQSASTDTGADSRGEKLKPAAWLSLPCGLVQTHIARRTANVSKTCQRSCWLGLDAGTSWLQCVDTSHQGPTPSPTTGLF